ncbi:ribbon-helix-helix domain-containing protein [Ruficoccus sp. ZRK36]|uniref:ribbon-helix-helix domain-containing protein n=1 Tax=Ruficoccus sp. ZRK36 TaxID=2866311 RepID=UPI001C733E9F|nr:ribbon-helix-helix domain-containing protein [Ruficoccus sp. ZRK36]QYY36926.1 ribbon-helix-helix domain-containing protein [Ruficoccus sp. ZRK36]
MKIISASVIDKGLSISTLHMAQRKQNHGRAPGKTQISISLPQNLVERIDKLADEENRNRSNFIATHLERLADGIVASEPAADFKAAKKK